MGEICQMSLLQEIEPIKTRDFYGINLRSIMALQKLLYLQDLQLENGDF